MNYRVSPYLLVAGSLLLIAGCGEKPYAQIRQQRQEKLALAQTGEGDDAALVKKEPTKKKSPSKSVKTMNLAEALEARDYYEQEQNDDMLLKVIPHLMGLSTDFNQLASLAIELADIQLSMGDLDTALKSYAQFISSYPGHTELQGARYRQILASWWNALEPDRDQAATRAALSFAAAYIKDYPQENAELFKVQEVLLACYRRLVDHELYAAKFYMTRYQQTERVSSLDAAQARLVFLQTEFLPAIKAYDRQLTDLYESLTQALETIAVEGEKLTTAARAELLAKQFLLVTPQRDPGTPSVHARDKF